MLTRIFFVLLSVLYTSQVFSQVQQVNIGDATLNYTETGNGEPVIFIHGGSGEYSDWATLSESYAKDFRVITYSRRYNYPNQNKPIIENFSEETEADDLAKMVQKLNLEPVHLVGHSFGSLTALAFAIKYPELTRSLVLSEPPIMNWLTDLEGGQSEYEKFHNVLMRPVKIAFDLRDTNAVLRHMTTYFYGEDLSAKLPANVRTKLTNNFPEWQALVNSPKAFTTVRREDVSSLKMPVLIISGGKSFASLQLISRELVRILPHAKHFHVAEGSHDYWLTHSKDVSGAVHDFLENSGKRNN